MFVDLKSKLQSTRLYQWARSNFHRVKKLTFFFSDICSTFNYMNWTTDNSQYWSLSAELLFQYHKLEKGLCIPGEKRFFGYDPALATVKLLNRWISLGFDTTSDPVFLGAVETLRAYRIRTDQTPPKFSINQLLKQIDTLLENFPAVKEDLKTPVRLAAHQADWKPAFDSIVNARRSVRAFKTEHHVNNEVIVEAIRVARMSPTACNRQPSKVHVFNDPKMIQSLLSLQNGNRGFGHTIPTLLILTADMTGFFDASERYQPYIDASLFCMSLIYSLQTQGISSCCLNWCVDPSIDQSAHLVGGIADNEKIIMFLGIGYATEDALTPKSPRRLVKDIAIFH